MGWLSTFLIFLFFLLSNFLFSFSKFISFLFSGIFFGFSTFLIFLFFLSSSFLLSFSKSLKLISRKFPILPPEHDCKKIKKINKKNSFFLKIIFFLTFLFPC